MTARLVAPHRWDAPDIDDDDRPRLVTDYVRAIEENQSAVRLQMFKNAYLYTGEEISNIDVDWQKRLPGRPELPRINVVQSVIETAYSRTISREPRLAVVTRGADWDLWRKARGMESYLDGTLRTMDWPTEWGRSGRDAIALGTGVAKIYRDADDKLACDRIFPPEVIVDEAAAMTSKPRAIFHRRFVDVDELAAQYPDHEDAIWQVAQSAPRNYVSYITLAPYVVPVVEAWSKPRSKDVPGRHGVYLPNLALVDEDWTRPRFPLVDIRWLEKLTGWYGIGIPEIVYFLQARVNRHAAYEMWCQNKAMSPSVFVDQPDADLQESLTNSIGQIIPFKGRMPPSVQTPPQVPPEIYADEERKIRQIYEITGMNEFATGARARPPTGLDSKPALQEWIDYTDGRFFQQEKRYDRGYVDAADIVIAETKELAAKGKMGKATWDAPRRGIVDVNWSDVDMERDRFRLKIAPASASTQDPAGLLQRLDEERAAGRLADDLYLYFRQTHDVEAFTNLYGAIVCDLQRVIAHLEDLDKPFPSPATYQGLQLGLWMVQMEWNRLDSLMAPPELLDRLSIWMEQAQALVGRGEGVPIGAPPQLGPAQAGGGPQAPQAADLGRLPMPGLAS